MMLGKLKGFTRSLGNKSKSIRPVEITSNFLATLMAIVGINNTFSRK